MLLLIIAIITLAFMINYFLKINFVTNNKIDDNKDTTTNDSISYSVAIASFEENRDAFLNFALFFLMYKRPFGYKDGVETQRNTRGTITGGNDRGNEGAGSSQGCNAICSNDPSCNAWQYSSGQCKKYTVSDPSHINITDLSGNSGEGDNIGYLFRPSDTSWAVSDLSGLSSNHDVFKSVADVVLLLDSTNEELLERASIVSASSNVKYCYEQEITQGGISQEYTTLRDDALKKLEDSCKFFIFSGDTDDFPNKTPYSLYFSLIVDVMREGLFETDSHLKEEILKAVDILKKYMADFKLIKDFFSSELDKDMNSSIDREELTNLYREKALNGNSWDAKVIGENFSIGADTCINESGITELVESFFSKYDLNQNGLVTLEEILSSLSIPQPKYTPKLVDSNLCTTTTTTTAAPYSPCLEFIEFSNTSPQIGTLKFKSLYDGIVTAHVHEPPARPNGTVPKGWQSVILWGVTGNTIKLEKGNIKTLDFKVPTSAYDETGGDDHIYFRFKLNLHTPDGKKEICSVIWPPESMAFLKKTNLEEMTAQCAVPAVVTTTTAAPTTTTTTTTTTAAPTTTTTTTTTTTEPPEDTWGGDKWPYKCYGCDKGEESAISDCEDVPTDRCKDGRFVVSKNNTLLPTPKSYGRDGDGNYIKFPRNDVTLCGWKDNTCQEVDSDFSGWEGG